MSTRVIRSSGFVMALTSALLASASLLNAEQWSLDRAITTALAQSPDAKIAQHRIDAAQSLIDQSNAAWMPQFMVQSRYTQTNTSMMAFGSILNQRAFSFALDFNHPGRIDNLNTSGTVAYNLYAGGRATAGRAAAKAGAHAAEEDARAVQNQLCAEVIKAYLNIRKAREAVAAVESGEKAYAAGVEAARARYGAGQMLKADMLSLEVQLAQTREMLSSVRHGAALAERAFLFVLGLDSQNVGVELAAEDPSLALIAAPESLSYAMRPELVGLQDRVQAAEAMVRVARGQKKPTVNAFGSYQYDQGWQLSRHADGWMAGVSVDVNVWDGGMTSGKIRQANAELAQVKEMLRKATLGVSLEVEQARLAHEDALERLHVSAQTVEQAEESASLTRARFEKGAVMIADVIGVESRLIESRMRRAVASADERIALAELRRALGLAPLTQP